MTEQSVISRFFLAFVLVISPPLVLGADAQPRQYEIELLIFENLVVADNGEVWPADYSDWFEESVDEPAPAPAEAEQREWLRDASQMRLVAERNTLGKSARYRVLAHFAWRQALLDRSGARAFDIPVEKTTGKNYVDGTVRVAVERYLHLNLDLQLHLARQDFTAQMSEAGFESPEIRLTESRRMRSKEVHYFDNPRFGVIALITPYESSGVTSAADAETTAQP